MTTYTFKDDSWWDNPCDCCESTYMEAFNALDDKLKHHGTFHSLEDCMIAVLNLHGVEADHDTPYNTLLDLMESNNLSITLTENQS